MGILDMLEGLAGQGDGAGHTAVAGGLMQELNQVGGVSGLVQSLQQNGAGGLVQQWANGQTQPANPNEVEQGVGSGMIDKIAERTGISPEMVKVGLATLLPILVHHLASSGHINQDGQATDAPAPDTGSLLQSVLGKLL